MKKLAALLCLLTASAFGQSVVNFAMTNRLTNLPDTNFFRVFSINDPVLAHGGIQTKGPATLVYPNTNGLASLTLLGGYYQMTNAYLGQGILFLVPGDTNTYNVNDIAVSGYNTYQVTGVRKITSNDGSIVISPTNGVGVIDIAALGALTNILNFGKVTSGTNSAATMQVNSGSTLTPSGTGQIIANVLQNDVDSGGYPFARMTNRIILKANPYPAYGSVLALERQNSQTRAEIDFPMPGADMTDGTYGTNYISIADDYANNGDYFAFLFDARILNGRDVLQYGLHGNANGRWHMGTGDLANGGGIYTNYYLSLADPYFDWGLSSPYMVGALTYSNGFYCGVFGGSADGFTVGSSGNVPGFFTLSKQGGALAVRQGWANNISSLAYATYTSTNGSSSSSNPGQMLDYWQPDASFAPNSTHWSLYNSTISNQFRVAGSQGLVALGGGNPLGNVELYIGDANSNVTTSIYIFANSNGISLNAAQPLSDALSVNRGGSTERHYLRWGQGDGTQDWRAGMDTNDYDLVFYAANGATSSAGSPGTEMFRLLSTGGAREQTNFVQYGYLTNLIVGQITGGLLPSGQLTNSAGSRVAYLNDISGAATNVINIAVNTNATAITNGSGLLVTISGVADTNVIRILGTNVAAYQALIATQALGSAAWVSSNTFWLTSSNLVYQGTNALASGAFTPSNTVWIASSNLVYQGTNALASGAYTPSNTIWLSASNLAYQATNGLATGAFTPSNTVWIASSNLVYQGTNALASGAYTPSNTLWLIASNLTQQATNAVVKQIQGTNILSGGSTLGQVLTATATGAAWSNAPAGGGGGGPGLPGTNTVVAYGDQYRTNAEAISSGGTVFSNAVGTVQLGSGGIWWTNAKSGNWGWITNDAAYFSNYVTGMIMTLTNASVTLSNTTAAGVYSILGITNLTLSPGSAGAINLLAADGATQIGNWTNGGIWASNPISAPAYTNSGLLSADAVATDSGGKMIQATAISMNHIAQPLVVSSLPLPMGAFYTNNQASPASAVAFTNLSGAWAFTSGQTNTIRLLSAMPGDWYPGTVKFDLFAACTSTNAGQDGAGHTNMVFYVKGAAIKAGGDLSNPTFGTAVWCTNHVSTNSYVAGECITTAITIGNSPSTNTPILWEIGRLAASGNGDTMTNSQACLIDAKVWYQYVLTNALPASTP